MPCLTLGKGLFPSIRTWKRFTTKLFQKLHPFKIIKITKTRRPKSTRTPPPMYYPPLPSKKDRRPRKAKDRHQLFSVSRALHRPKQHNFKKQALQAPPPVFIDELFWSHPREVQGGPPGCSRSVLAKGKGVMCVDQLQVGPEMGVHNASSADEMWESVGLGSPQMSGIDARAEEFITRFRAELEFQEIVAHRL